MAKQVLLSGVKPTGKLHIGNYFGAIRQFVSLQSTYDCYFMLADYHAMNTVQNGKEMRAQILELATDYLALGLDPHRVVIFKQSDVSAHTELAWIFDTITTMPYLMRAHAFKDAEAKDKEISVGTFNYPMLMAADILLYDTDLVPVGQDQKQHIEYTRDTAQKFNNTFGETFKLPKEHIIDNVKTVPGNDGRKMSKSYGNQLYLFASDEEIIKFVMSIVTDSSSSMPVNVRAIHELLRDKAYLDQLYADNAGKYKALKDALVADLIAFIRPLREAREKYAKNPKKVMKILTRGAKQAHKRADKKLDEVKRAVGVAL
ncbi:MAG: tryptophan--tRNA ligase [Candidatus Taylorbacteria bacterium CG10_big_fil_rev_8_21_14_0_10_41_48]|uniref:Tryptophan--tRNA ligase n=1 Tax=Candidatus Taylorbacteria bacterium CG10_big_fil_rev_8_21_14_0_10_41_48 TaxID=1975024 RepID=A0A2M8LCH2_9BACT|nr:MAG: tryptophan--tRNA ligase [Candidatus Taylorbacteria bacterium CG10_big_fil_rev_8_21_14_0_10_41_48]